MYPKLVSRLLSQTALNDSPRLYYLRGVSSGFPLSRCGACYPRGGGNGLGLLSTPTVLSLRSECNVPRPSHISLVGVVLGLSCPQDLVGDHKVVVDNLDSWCPIVASGRHVLSTYGCDFFPPLLIKQCLAIFTPFISFPSI